MSEENSMRWYVSTKEQALLTVSIPLHRICIQMSLCNLYYFEKQISFQVIEKRTILTKNGILNLKSSTLIQKSRIAHECLFSWVKFSSLEQ